jgi:ATP-dependent helicase/nuclease subunit B
MRRSLFSIAPDAPFLKVLASRILDGTLAPDWPRQGPFWLSDMTIYLPTKRARLALIDIFLERLGGAALLPNIYTMGESDEVENAFFAEPDLTATNPASKTARTLFLARLIEGWAHQAEKAQQVGFASPPSAAEILAMAQSLGQLLDDFLTEEIDYRALSELVPDELAENWKQSLQFIQIVTENWPLFLEGQGLQEVASLRSEKFALAQQSLKMRYGERPVFAAGSTGSVPANARFLAEISTLPNGALILPGFDTSMSAADFGFLLDPQNKAHAHPQFGMAKFLRLLNSGPQDVVELSKSDHTRAHVLHQALATAENTAHWHEEREKIGDGMIAATDQLSLLSMPNEALESRAIALATRQTLAENKSVGIVAPDRDQARQIIAELHRFDISVDDSAGVPLNQSPAGRLVRLMLQMVQSQFTAIDLVGFLTHSSVCLGRDRGTLSALREVIDLSILRGLRGKPGLAGLKRAVEKAHSDPEPRQRPLNEEEADALINLLEDMDRALAPIISAFESGAPSLMAIAKALPGVVLAIIKDDQDKVHAPHGYDQLSEWLIDLASGDVELSRIATGQFVSALSLLMSPVSVRPLERARHDVQLWGRIEARLQSADVMILAGLNEGVWPEDADPGPWMSRGMKMAIGLEPPERKVGLAAHDFLMALSAPQVILSYAERRGTSPADQSRFLKRLLAFVGGDCETALKERVAHLKAWTTQIDAVPYVQPAPRPTPQPPAALRPRRLSITEIETLLRDPYAIYAKHILGLRPLDPLGAPPDFAERGNLIHDVLGDFIADGHDCAAADAHDKMMDMARSAYERLADVADRRDIWLKRFDAIAHAFLKHETTQNLHLALRHAEIRGETQLDIAGVSFTLHGRADRVDQTQQGDFEIVDFKTGGVPSKKDMESFMAPQLPMAGLIARQGGFAGLGRGNSAVFRYIKLAHGPDTLNVTNFPSNQSAQEWVDQYWERFSRFAEMMLLRDDIAMVAQLNPKPEQRFEGDYDHLARAKEWAPEGEDE